MQEGIQDIEFLKNKFNNDLENQYYVARKTFQLGIPQDFIKCLKN